MPKKNFANTVIYKVQCNNECIFGHCGNIYAFKHSLKTKCNNGKKGELYDTIRNNGGFENCQITIVEHFTSCKSKQDADKRVEECKKEYYKPSEKSIQEAPQLNVDGGVLNKKKRKTNNKIQKCEPEEELKLEHISNNIIEQITTLYGDDIRTFLHNTRGDGREDSDKIVFAINVIIDTIILKLIETIENTED